LLSTTSQRGEGVSEPETQVADLWQGVKSHLTTDARITPQLWGFLDLVEPRGVMAGVLYLEVPNELTRGMLEQRVRLPLLEALESTEDSGVSSFAIVVNPDIESDVLQIPLAEAVAAEILSESFDPGPIAVGENQSRLNMKYSFDNFVIGSSNRFSHAAAVAVAEAPAAAYNPLFIYGGSGLGKTHLLHAIGHYAISLFKGCRVRYVSSEEFTNDFINAIANNRAPEFQARYREVDILLIDDIQFLQGKDSTQEAFFHTFNTLHDHNKQVVVTSDLPPKQLTGFEDRMRSRFEWGLITDVQAPDLETRIAILRRKAASERIDINDDVVELMASKVSSNVRELEGALIRVTAFSNLNKAPISMDLARSVLKDLVLTEDTNVVSPVDIINITATFYQLTVDDLYGSSRSQTIALARQVAMYLSREMTNLSLPKIGQLFGNRDHTTVMYANKKISELMKERRSIYNQVTELTSRIKQSSNYAN
jgi:chromosomal replication initiator protein